MEELQQNKTALEGSGKPLLKNTNFLFLWAATLFKLCFSLFTFSQTWYIAKTLNLEASLGVVFVALSVPRLIFMIVGGAVADKFPKKYYVLLQYHSSDSCRNHSHMVYRW